MSEFILDLTNYRETSSARVEPGDYTVEVEAAELTKAKSSGNPMVVLNLRIVGTEFDGLTLIDRLTLTEKAMFRVVAFMQAIGLPTPRKKFKLSTARFVGKRLTVTVEDDDPYQGTIKSVVRGYARPAKDEPDGGTTPGADEDDLFGAEEAEDLDADFDGEEDEVVEPAPAPAPAPRKAAPAPGPLPEEYDEEYADLDDVDLDDIDV